MKHITLHIPDNKYSFFRELLKRFDYIKVDEVGIAIPEDHKNTVRKRVKTSEKNPSRLLDWDKAKHDLNY